MANNSISDNLSSTISGFAESVGEAFEEGKKISTEYYNEGAEALDTFGDRVVEFKDDSLQLGDTLLDEVQHPLRHLVPDPENLKPGEEQVPKTISAMDLQVGTSKIKLDVSIQTKRSDLNPDEYSSKLGVSFGLQAEEGVKAGLGYHAGIEVKGDAKMIDTLKETTIGDLDIGNDELVVNAGIDGSLGLDTKVGEVSLSGRQDLNLTFDEKGYASTESSVKIKSEISVGPGMDIDVGPIDLNAMTFTHSKEMTVSKTNYRDGSTSAKIKVVAEFDGLGKTVFAETELESKGGEVSLDAKTGHVSYSDNYTSVFGKLTGATRKVSDFQTGMRF